MSRFLSACSVCLTGVSGSGKSTLAEEILIQGNQENHGDPQGGRSSSSILGTEAIEDVLLVDQKPIGRSPRANPLTYLKAMDPIRHLLANTEAAGKGYGGRGSSPSMSPTGRCPTCEGAGFEKWRCSSSPMCSSPALTAAANVFSKDVLSPVQRQDHRRHPVHDREPSHRLFSQNRGVWLKRFSPWGCRSGIHRGPARSTPFPAGKRSG